MLRTAADFSALADAPRASSALLGIRHRIDAARGDDASAPSLRIGIAASRKVGGAVVRNRIRRRLKSIARELAPRLPSGTDILIGVRPEAATASSAELRDALLHCLRRAKLVAADVATDFATAERAAETGAR